MTPRTDEPATDSPKLLDDRGEYNQGGLVAVVLLVIALIVVFFLWQRDRQSADAHLDVNIGMIAPGPATVPAPASVIRSS